MKTKSHPETSIRILNIGTCSTLSGRSDLVYHVGCKAESDVHIRIVQNSGNGQFNADWVSLATIEKLLNEHPADKPMSSRVLLPVFRSKSSNSPAFLFTALLAEGLVKVGVEKDSGYTIGDVAGFRQAMSTLIASDTNLDVAVTASSEAPKRKRKE